MSPSPTPPRTRSSHPPSLLLRRWVVSLGGGAFAEMRWLSFVPWWNTAGLSDCIPIVSAALTAQTQFFLIYQVRHPSTHRSSLWVPSF